MERWNVLVTPTIHLLTAVLGDAQASWGECWRGPTVQVVSRDEPKGSTADGNQKQGRRARSKKGKST